MTRADQTSLLTENCCTESPLRCPVKYSIFRSRRFIPGSLAMPQGLRMVTGKVALGKLNGVHTTTGRHL